jgi:hypothetical protein
MKKQWWRRKRVWGTVAALGFLIGSFWGADPKEILKVFRDVHPLYLIPVILGIIGMPLARAARLKYLIDLEREVKQGRIFAIYNVGQMLNQMFPALTGQVARIVMFSRTLGITKTFAFTIVMLEVLFDGIILMMFIFGTSFLTVLPPWMVRGELNILLVCLLLFGFFYFALHRSGKKPVNPNSWLRRKLPGRVIREWDNVRTSFIAGLTMLKSGKHLIAVVLLSVLSWLAHALLVLFLLRAFGFDFALWTAMVILIVNTLAIMIPVTPGNIGTFQFACIVGLAFFGVSRDRALGFSILLHLTEVAPVFILGLISSFSQHVRVREYRTPEAIEEQERLTQQVLDFGESALDESGSEGAKSETPPSGT